MLKKLALDKTKEYEKHIALEEISEMLVNFAKGLSHHSAIGAEQGDIDGWDDFVIETKDKSKVYIQVKRQTTDFSTDAIVRDRYKKGKREGELKDLSVLDEAFKSLADITIDDRHKLDQFWLVLPETKSKDLK